MGVPPEGRTEAKMEVIRSMVVMFLYPPSCYALSWHAGVRRLVIQEVEVDAVRVVRDDDGEECDEGARGFAPGAPGHGAGVVDDKDGVERVQEVVGVFCA